MSLWATSRPVDDLLKRDDGGPRDQTRGLPRLFTSCPFDRISLFVAAALVDADAGRFGAFISAGLRAVNLAIPYDTFTGRHHALAGLT